MLKYFILYITLLFGLITPNILMADSFFQGNWSGDLSSKESTLPIIFHLFIKDGKLLGSMDSPDQAAYNIPVFVSVHNLQIIITQPKLQITFKGYLQGQQIHGEFTQGKQLYSLDLNLLPNTHINLRPQHPHPPFTYINEEVHFKNLHSGHTLAGTLSYPANAGRVSAIILISGSGQQDRDQTIFGHKPFLVLADHFARSGFAVLRYDDRGTGYSEGDSSMANSFDFSQDTLAAFQFLKQHKHINPHQIGLLGHSEGANIAQLIARQEMGVAFLISLAGQGVKGTRVYARQLQQLAGAISNKNKYIPDIEKFIELSESAAKNPQSDNFRQQFFKLFPSSEKKQFKHVKNTLSTPWFRYFLNYSPAQSWAKIKCPILAINGSKDTQVNADENLNAIEKSLNKQKHPDFEIKKFTQLNHLFQTSETGKVNEYRTIEETFSIDVMYYIENWLKKRFPTDSNQPGKPSARG